MIEKGSMFKAWEATTEQQKKAHEMQAIYKAQETARQAIQEAMNRYIKKKTRARSVAKAEADPFAELEGWESLEQIQEAYGYGEITSDRRDKLTDLWEAREAPGKTVPLDGRPKGTKTEEPATSPPEETASPPTGAREERTMQNEQPREHGRPGHPYCQHGPDPYADRDPHRRCRRRERSSRTH